MNPRSLVLHVQVTREGQRALALNLVHKDRDGGKVDLQRQFVEGKQGAAGDAEIATARLATEVQRTGRAAAFIDGAAFAALAEWLAVRCGPADRGKCRLGFFVGHAQALDDTKCAGTGCKE